MSVFHDILLIATLNRFELTTGDGRPDTTDVCCKVTGGKPSSQPCNILYAMHHREKSNYLRVSPVRWGITIVKVESSRFILFSSEAIY